MSNITKNNIIANLHEYKNDKDIDTMFSFILPPNQKRSFINFFLQRDNSRNLSIYSKKLFSFLLVLEQSYQNKTQIFNYTNSLVEFLSEIQDSEYLRSNFHFISRSIQQILKFFFSRKEYGSFSIISYKAKLLDLEEIPVLPLFFNQDQEIEQSFEDYLFFIKTFLSYFNEKLIIWCYLENIHVEFCKIIDKRKTYTLDKFSELIIKQRIQLSQDSFYHYPNHFISFLLKLYPSIDQTLENCNLSKKHKSSNQLENRPIVENKDLSLDFDDSKLPFFNVHHFFNVSQLRIKNEQQFYVPQSLPPTSTKLFRIQTEPKFEFNMNPSMAERFSNIYISFQSKNYVSENYTLPNNFSIEKLNSVLRGNNGSKGKDDNVSHYYQSPGSFNRSQSSKIISNKKVNILLGNSSLSQPNNQSQKLKNNEPIISSHSDNTQFNKSTEQDKNFEDKTTNVKPALAPPQNSHFGSKKIRSSIILAPPININTNVNNKTQQKQVVVQKRNTSKITIQKSNSSSTTDDK